MLSQAICHVIYKTPMFAKQKPCYCPSVVRALASHETRLQGPNVTGFVARATLQFSHHMCHRSALSPDGGTVCPELDWKGKLPEVMGVKCTSWLSNETGLLFLKGGWGFGVLVHHPHITPPPLLSICYNGSLMGCVHFDLFDFNTRWWLAENLFCCGALVCPI